MLEQEYYSHLAQIQSDNPPTMVLLSNADKLYAINLEERTVEAPKFLSIRKDHAAETVYFVVDRYYDYVDLKDMICIIQYIAADGQVAKIYPVPFYDVTTLKDERKMIIPWNISRGVTDYAGTVTYAFTFYKLDEARKNFIYNLNIQPATSEILYGLNAVEISPENFQVGVDQYEELVSLVMTNMRKDLYWTDLY